MTNVLSQASRQWATRPADQSFLDLQSLNTYVQNRTAQARESKRIPYRALSVAPQENGDLRLVGSTSQTAAFTHWSFGQLCSRAKAPADFMRTLPADLASKCLTHQLYGADTDVANLLFHQNGDLTVRAFTTPIYSRIWDADITSRLLNLPGEWQPAPETRLPNGGTTRGLYASDHDVFCFLVDNNRRVFESSPTGGLSRGFMVANSEVGDKSFWLMTFLYNYICGNHLVWGARNVTDFRIRHVGAANDRAFFQLRVALRTYADSKASEDEAKIQRAMTYKIADSKNDLLDKLFGLKTLQLSRKTLESAYTLAEQHESWYGSPRTAWGIGNGLTEHAKQIPYADQRTEVERAAGKIFEMAF